MTPLNIHNPCLGVTCSTTGSDCFDDSGSPKCICSDNTDAYVLTSGTWAPSETEFFDVDAADVTCRPSTGCIDVTCGDNQHCVFGRDSDDLPVNYCRCDRGFVSINDTSNQVYEQVSKMKTKLAIFFQDYYFFYRGNAWSCILFYSLKLRL